MIVAGVVLVAFFAGRASAAELPRIQRVTGWSVTIYFLDYEAAGTGHRRLSGYVETRDQCEAIRAATVTKLPGGKLRCDFIDELLMVPR